MSYPSNNESVSENPYYAGLLHDLRNQLQLIENLSEVLLDTSSLDKEQQNWLRAIQHAGEMASRQSDFLLQELLNREVPHQPEFFHIRSIIDSIEKGLEPDARVKGVALKTEVETEVPEVLWGEPLFLSQALLNLTRNAILYGEKGTTVRLTAQLADKHDQGVDLNFIIQDDGQGLPPEVEEAIGKAYNRGDGPQKGQGLGLYMVTRWVEAMGGNITFDNHPGEGLTVTIHSPFTRKSNPSENGKDSAHKPFSILLVEDNQLNRTALERILSRNFPSASLRSAGNLEEAEALVTNDQVIDLALIDLYLHGQQHGQRIAERVRTLSPKAHITALSAMPLASVRPPFNQCIFKPVKPEELIHLIAQHIA